MTDRTLRVPGLANARDLGGLPRRQGGTTPFGVFLRSERPDRVGPEGWRLLAEHGVRAVLDLRQPGEREAHRAAVPTSMADLHVDHDGLDAHPAFWAGYWDNGLVGTPLYYGPHLAALPERTVDVLSTMATAPAGLLFHCAGGRDRTGLVSAILLTVAGVDRDAVVADYLTSIANAEALAAGQGRPNGEAEIVELLAAHGTTSEAAIRTFLDELDVERLLAALPAQEAATIRTWHGTLDAS